MTPDTRVPSGIERETWVLREGVLSGKRAFDAGVAATPRATRRLDAYVYRAPRKPLATYVVAPGLHFSGPDDPRFDRFCRVLANAGFVVVAPYLPSFASLRVDASAVDDFEIVVRAACVRFAELGRVALFSISFGSWPALEVAARCGDEVDGLITFGGYADFESVARFCLDGRAGDDPPIACDPLNRPALFLNLLPHLEVDGDPSDLERAFTLLCYRTWGRMELKQPGRLEPFIDELAMEVATERRELFRVGASGSVGAMPLLEQALARGADELAFLSPRAALARIRCPVVVCHGRDDDVIPYRESEKLERALTHAPHRLLLTGLFAHTGQGRPSATKLFRKARTLLAIVHTLGSAGRLARVVA